ncbi:MAG: DUF1385 domain-containing protein [Polyangiales bacterium]|nr:DUF1385 domain-containing protein [Myxococcales bacterium]MCB9660400.1 DUF1385 domain-containing protein [Sandaracinaceae bacterium]
MSDPKPYIGGQAVIEGVMMRAPGCMSVAVRRPDGTLVVREGPMTSRFDHKPWKWPGFRGVAALVESMRIGFGALQFSAEQQMTEEERAAQGSEGKGTMLFAALFAIGLFVALPQLLATGTGKLFGLDLGLTDARYHWIIGGFKLLVFCAYLAAISRVKEIRRTFEYHGAEHKTIHAYEQGLPLTVANVRAQTTLHPRCGTTFLVVVILVSIVAGSVAAPLLLPNAEGLTGNLSVLLLRIALLPFISALSFELQRLSARFCTTGPLRVFLWPGFLFQKITTREPDDQQIEVAITALQAAAWRGDQGEEAPSGDAVLVFPSFEGFTEALPALRSAA